MEKAKEYATEALKRVVDNGTDPYVNVSCLAAKREINRRLRKFAAGEGKPVLAELKLADDFEILETAQETYYDGPDGPYTRNPAEVVRAFGHIWQRKYRWIDKGRDCRNVWYETR